MAKPRSVKFQHRSNANHDNRRISSSTSGESVSDPGSPHPNGDIKSANGVIPKLKESAKSSDYEQKKEKFITRATWTFAMIGAFFTALLSGHIYILMIITAVQTLVFKEVIAVAQVPAREKNLPLTRSLNWYFFAVVMYFLYGESIIYYFKHILLVDKVLIVFATHHRFLSFMLYTLGRCIGF